MEGVRRQHRLERTGVEDQQLHVGLGHDVRRADATMEQRELAEIPPGRELRDLTPPQPARRDP
jgi:hypothetical protein